MANLSWFSEWNANWTLVLTLFLLGVILLVFAIGLGMLTYPLWKVARALKKHSQSLVILGRQAQERAPDSLPNGTAHDTARGRIEAVLSRDPRLGKPFRQFLKAWREAAVSEERGALGELRFEDFLPFEVLLHDVSNRRLAQAFPGMLVALGILGTFIGLVVALPSAGLGQTTISSLEELRETVGTITSGLGIAFLTSIAGIGCSLVFLWFDRKGVYSLEANYRTLACRIAELYPTLSPPEVAKLIYEQLNNTCVAIEQMGTDLATKLADTLGAQLQVAFQESFGAHAERIEQAVTSLVSATSHEQLEALSKLVDRFWEQANTALSEEFGRLQESMRLAADAQEDFRHSIEGFGQTLSAAAAAHTSLLDNTARAGEALVRSLDRLEAIAVSLGSSAEKLTVASRHFDEAAEAATSLYQAVSEGQERLLESMEQQLELLKEARQTLLSSWKEALESAEKAIERIRDITKELETGVAEHLLAALNRFDEALAEALRRFGSTLGDLRDTIETFPNVLLEIRDAATLIGDKTDLMRGVLERVETLFSKEMFGDVERAAEIVSRLENVIAASERLVTQSGDLQDQFAETARALAAHSSGTREATVVLERVESAVQGLSSELVQLNTRLRGLAEQFDGNGSLSQLRRSLEALTDKLGSLSGPGHEAKKPLDVEQPGGFWGRLFGR